MSDCEKIQETLLGLTEGDTAEIDIRGHLSGCAECRDLYEAHSRLADLSPPEPDDADLLEVRRNVLRQARAGEEGRSEAFGGWLGRWFARPAFAATAALVLLAVGFLAGYGGPKSGAPASATTGTTGSIERDLSSAALANDDLDRTENSPYVYSNVRVKELEGDRVALSFDVSTHMQMVRPRTDPLVSEILVQSLVNPAPLGTRLQAVSLARALEPKVRDALIVALLGDPDLAVRLKALEKLAAQEPQAEIQAALLEVLKREESVQLRLLAIDRLAETHVMPEALSAALAEGRPEPGTAVEARARAYLADF